jgi:DNA modification methylase
MYCKSENFTLYHGDNRQILPTLAENSVDAIVTDPPYELGFMGKSWDASGVAFDPATWREALRVLKPGGHLIAFSGSRTYHRMAVAIEDAGFEIRDQIMWIYGSGFPKSHNISKGIDKAAGTEREVLNCTFGDIREAIMVKVQREYGNGEHCSSTHN